MKTISLLNLKGGVPCESVADVYSLLKESFKDILQELMEAELDAALGYEKN